MIDVSVIIVNYNTMQLTKNCIDSIFEHTKNCSFEVILVDNASSDGSADMFKNDGRIKFIASHENLGFGRGNNLGYAYAQGKYIFFLNSDTYLVEDSISNLFNFAENNSNLNIGALGVMLVDSKGRVNKPYSHIPSTNLLKKILRKLNFGVDSNRYINHCLEKNGFSRIGFVCGADLFTPKKVLDQIGLFDEKIFMFAEEIDLCKRMTLYGLNNYVLNDKGIVHLGGSSFADEMKNFYRYRLMTISIVYYWKKYKTGLGLWWALFFRKLIAYRDMRKSVFSKEQKKEIYSLIQ